MAKGQWLRRVALVAVFATVAALSPLFAHTNFVQAADFTTRRLSTSDAMVGATNVHYNLSFSGQSTGNVGSLRLQVCANDPFPGSPCTVPVGFDISSAQLLSQTGMTGFTILGAHTTANEIVLTRTPGPTNTGTVSYELGGITNPSNPGTYYGRLETFTTTDATGASSDAGGLAFAFVGNDLSIHTYVPPYLAFCIGNTITDEDCATAEGNYIDLGELSPTRTATGQTKLLVATNADYGYSITVLGTTLTSGINVIPGIVTPDVSRPGTSQFGLNLRANSTPSAGSEPAGMGRGNPTTDYNIPNRFKFVSGDTLAGYNDPDYYRMYTASYMVNVSKDQPAGVYVTTLMYIALATF